MVALHRFVRGMAAVGALWAIAAGSLWAQPSGSTPSKAEVVAALKEREQRLKSFSVILQTKQRQSTLSSGQAGGGAEMSPAQVGEISFLCDGPRIRVESKSMQGTGDSERVVDRTLAVVDGEAVRQLRGSADAWGFAAIQPANYGLPLSSDPRDFLTRIEWRDALSTTLEKATFASVTMRKQGDVQLLEIAPPARRYINNSREKWSVMFDVTHGFALTQIVRYRSANLDAPWVKGQESTAGEFVEAAKGVWVPTVARREDNYAVRRTDGTGKEVSQNFVRQVEVVFKDWKIDPPTEADTFVLDFPSGVTVQDELAPYNKQIRERRPKASGDGAPLIPFFAMRSPTAGIWVNLGVAVALATLIVFRRRRNVA